MAGLFRDLNPFELEAQARVNKHLKGLGHSEPHYYHGQFVLKAKTDTLRELQWFADEYGGDLEVESGSFRDTWVQVFTVAQVEGIKVRMCVYVSDEEAEAHGLW